MPLSDEQVQGLAGNIASQPAEFFEDMMDDLRTQGVANEDLERVLEAMPVDFGIESREFAKGGLEGLTLGAFDAGESDPRAGDVEIFGSEFSPSRTAGEVAGTLPIAVATRGVGMNVGARVASNPLVQKGIGVALGEAIPGTAQGLIRSEGDIEEGLKMAAIWTATGFVGEGVMAGIGKAFKQMKAGKAVTEGQDALRELKTRVISNLEKIGATPEDVQGKSLKELTEMFPDLVRAPDLEEGMVDISMNNALQQLDNVNGMTTDQELVELFQSFNHDLGLALTGPAFTPTKRAQVMGQLNEAFNTAARAVREGMPVTQAARILNMARNASIKPSALKKNIEDILEQFGAKRAASSTKVDVDVPTFASGKMYSIRRADGEGAETVLYRGRAGEDAHRFQLGDEEIIVPDSQIVSSTRLADVSGGTGPNPDDPNVLRRTAPSERQIEQLADLEDELGQLGGSIEKRPTDLNVESARHRITALREEIRIKKDVETARAVNEVLKSEGLSGVIDDRSIRMTVDDTQPGRFSKFLGPQSKIGLGKNPVARETVLRTQLMFEDITNDVDSFLHRYNGAMDLLGQPSVARQAWEGVIELFGGSPSQATQSFRQQQNLLVQALDGRPDRILEANPHLIEPYTELRGILDELAERLGLDPGQRITDYFPHLFRGPQGKWLAQRLKRELGSKGEFIERFRNKPLNAEFQRMGAEGYDVDLDAVMHSYIRGAAEKPHMDDFAKRMFRATNLTTGETKKQLEAFGLHILGKPGPWKKKWAHYWQNNELFNRMVDDAVEIMGDSETRGLLTAVRKGEDGPQQQKMVLDFFNSLVKNANTSIKDGGLRHKLGLKIEEMRAAMVDPEANPILLDKMYKVMVVNKLGFSASHFITNLTQTLTNTFPELGFGQTTKAMAHMINPSSKKLHGRAINELLEESRVFANTPESREFLTPGGRISRQVVEIAMKPADWSERFNRGVAFIGAYDKFMKEGLEHPQAMIKARLLSSKTNFNYNRAGAPNILHPPSLRSLLMFRSFASHQVEFTADLIQRAREGDMGPLRRMMMAYVGLAGVGAGLHAGFGARGARRLGEHPGLEIGTDLLTFDLTDVGGPPADALLDLIHGRFSEAVEGVVKPTILGRMERAADAPDAGQSLLELSGFAN